MTLDQVIEYERKQEKSYRHDAQIMANMGAMEPAIANIEAVAKIHKQIADYLEELKSYRLHIFSGEQTKTMLEEERNKTIDDFVEKIQWEYLNSCGIKQREIEFLIAVSSQVAEQLKVGGKNDNQR